MPTQHARKREARALQAYAPHLITYTQALAEIDRRHAYDVRKFSANYDQQVLTKAADTLAAGGNVLVFGGSGSGKSTVIHSIMELLQGVERRYIFQRSFGVLRQEDGFKTEDKTYSIGGEVSELLALPAATSPKVVALNELRSQLAVDELNELVSASYPTMFGLHSLSLAQVIVRGEFLGIDLSACLFVEVRRDTNGKRQVFLA